MTTVDTPSGTDEGMVVVDEKVKVARFSVWADKSQLPVVSSLLSPELLT
jgi:hypothetical protein